MKLTIVHGDIESAEEQRAIEDLREAITGRWTRTHGTNDTTTWTLHASTLPISVEAFLLACQEKYPHWKVSKA